MDNLWRCNLDQCATRTSLYHVSHLWKVTPSRVYYWAIDNAASQKWPFVLLDRLGPSRRLKMSPTYGMDDASKCDHDLPTVIWMWVVCPAAGIAAVCPVPSVEVINDLMMCCLETASEFAVSKLCHSMIEPLLKRSMVCVDGTGLQQSTSRLASSTNSGLCGAYDALWIVMGSCLFLPSIVPWKVCRGRCTDNTPVG